MTTKIQTFRVNAFGENPFSGNPATVCVLDSFLEDDLLQKIARENLTSETAYIVIDKSPKLRWFSSTQEVNLCGHGTLAAAHTLLHSYSFNSSITFETRSGPLEVIYQEPYYTLQLPSYELNPHSNSEALVSGLGTTPKEIYKSNSVIAILHNESELKEIVPQFEELKKVGTRSIIVSAPGKGCDYVLRYFTPSEKNQEDYVTGVAQCSLVPY